MAHANVNQPRIVCRSVAICLVSMLTSVWFDIAQAQQPAKIARG